MLLWSLILLTSLTGIDGEMHEVTFSPDSQNIAFHWIPAAGRAGIFRRPIAGGQPKLIAATDSNGSALRPAWSPDGKSIAFIRSKGRTDYRIFIAPADGGPERKVASSSCRDLIWSPDSRYLITGQFNNLNQPDEWNCSLVLMSVESGKAVAKLAARGGQPALSRDGKMLAYRDLQRLYLLSLNSNFQPAGPPRLLVTETREIGAIEWMPGAKQLLYSIWGPRTQFRAVGFNGAPPRSLRDLDSAGLENDIRSIRFSPNGALAVAEVNQQRNALWRFDTASARLEKFRDIPWTSSMLRFTPNGSLTFLSIRNAAKEIWTAAADGGNARSVYTSKAGILYQEPSPDGKTIAFLTQPGGLFTIPATGGEPKRLLPKLTVFPISWSRKGSSLYFATAATDAKEDRIWRLPLSGGEAVEIVKQDSFAARESVDGKYLYFTNSRYPKLHRMQLSGGNVEAVSDQYLHFWSDFVVSPKAVYYIARGLNDADLTLMKVDPATVKSTKAVRLDFHPTLMQLSPDGQSIYLERRDPPTGSLCKMEGFTAFRNQ